MSLFRRSDSGYWWYNFVVRGRRYQKSTGEPNKREAAKIEAAARTKLAKRRVGLEEPEPAPTLAEFSQQFIDEVEARHAAKPETIRFYSNRLKRLLGWEPFQNAALDMIDAKLIARYISQRRKKVGIVSVNRELATLRRALHLAEEWEIIKATPKVKLLTGEPQHDFVLTRELEPVYLAACPPLLRDVAVLLLDTGLRLGEALTLRWSDVHLEPVGNARYGWVHIREGKSKNAIRNVPLVARVSRLLKEKQQAATSAWVFPGEPKPRVKKKAAKKGAKKYTRADDERLAKPDLPLLGSSLAHMHAKVCRPIVKGERQYLFPKDVVLHSLRHTAITRLGEAGAETFTIMKQAGHFSATISQRYVHPSPETVERAYDRLEALNQKALADAAG
jgi:integrase